MSLVLKRFLFVIGIALASAAFLAAGAEIAALAMNPDLGLLPSAAQVWHTLAPTSFATVQESPVSAVWLGVMRLPGWLVLGAPGLALIITCRERDGHPDIEDAHSLFLFDELAKQAREQGYDGSDDASTAASAFDFEPADAHYADDDVADDVLPEHDFLLGGHADAPKSTDAER